MPAWISGADVQAWIGADKITLPSAQSLAQVASDAVQSKVLRDLTLQTNITDIVDTNGSDYVLLNYWPIRAIAGPVTLNGQTLQPAAFNQPGWRLDPRNPRKLVFAGMGKQRRGVMNVTVAGLTAGYDVTAEPGSPNALPGHVHQALLLTASAIFNSQAADPNLTAEETAGVFSGSFHPAGVGSIPPGALSYLAPEIPANP